MDLGERAEQLATELIHPLVVGGDIDLQRPFGPKLALQIGENRKINDNDLRMAIDTARLRVARQVVAVDVLPDLDQPQWALVAMLNDLLQVTNHELSSFASRSRHETLLTAIEEVCATIAPPRDLQEVVGRHATFARLLSIKRVDTKVKWWTGSASFRGQRPPDRLLAWPELRNVKIDTDRVVLSQMAEGVPVQAASFHAALCRFLGCTPLTDLATVARSEPPFEWGAGTLTVVATTAGTNLALRAFEHQEPSLAAWRQSYKTQTKSGLENLATATAALPDSSPEQTIAKRYIGQLKSTAKLWAEQVR